MDFRAQGVNSACFESCPTFQFPNCETAIAQARVAAEQPPRAVEQQTITAEITLGGTALTPQIRAALERTLRSTVADTEARVNRTAQQAALQEHRQRQTNLATIEARAESILTAYRSGMAAKTDPSFGAWAPILSDDPHPDVRSQTLSLCCLEPVQEVRYVLPAGSTRRGGRPAQDAGLRAMRRYTRASNGSVTTEYLD